MKRNGVLLIAVLMVFALLPQVASAASYEGYVYDSYRISQPAPNGYLPERAVDLTGLDERGVHEVADFFVADNGEIFLLDTGNLRIVVLSKDFVLLRQFNGFLDANGDAVEFKSLSGIHVGDDGEMTVADTVAQAVYVGDRDGKLKRTITRPNTVLLKEEERFEPLKVLTNDKGLVYVLCRNIYQGAMVFDQDERFLGFYGANKVEASVELLADYLWKTFILTKEQRALMARYVPTEYANFTLDSEQFLYVVSKQRITNMGEVKKLNPLGQNILTWPDPALPANYGDLETYQSIGGTVESDFVDISVDSDGYINILDRERRRIFQYSQNSELLTVFGGPGYQLGSTSMPIAVESQGDKVFVLEKTGVITVYSPTVYGKDIRTAHSLYEAGEYEESSKLWRSLLTQNVNCELAYTYLGKTNLLQGDFASAMDMFQFGFDRNGYSRAFKGYRSQVIRSNLPFILTGLLVLLAGFLLLRKRMRAPAFLRNRRFTDAMWTMIHPAAGFDELNMTKNWSISIAVAVVLLWTLATIMTRQLTGFTFNYNRPEDLNILLLLGTTAGLYFLFTVANWGLSSLTDGEGTFKEICIATAYALIPYVVSRFLLVILSNLIILEEAPFLQWIGLIGILWSFVILLGAIKGVHQFSMGRTVLTLGFTLVGMAAIAFVMLLVYSLVNQIVQFLVTVLKEIFFLFR